MKLFRTLFAKISLVFVLLITVFSIVQFLIFTWHWARVSGGSEQLANWNVAGELAADLRPHIEREIDYRSLRTIVRQYVTANPKLAVFILDAEGNVIDELSFGDKLRTPTVPLAPIHEFLNSSPTNLSPIVGKDPRGGRAVFTAARLTLAGAPAYLYLVLDSTVFSNIAKLLHQTTGMRTFASIYVLVTLSAVLVGILAFFKLTTRFNRVTAVVRQFGSGNFEQRLRFESDDELGELATAVDQMAEKIVTSIQQLEARDQLRRQLIADVSHDLRGPVAAIRASSESIAPSTPNTSPLDWQRFHAIIERNTASLARLLSELFELSKLETQERAAVLEPVPIVELLEELTLKYESSAGQQGIALIAEAEDPAALVLADIQLLERALANLIENAIRFTPAGGTISVGIRAQADTNTTLVYVRDTGIGIAESDLPKVFDRFYQATTEQRTKGGSTGLGLAIVKKIVQAHGSEVLVRSTENQGTTFEFSIRTCR